MHIPFSKDRLLAESLSVDKTGPRRDYSPQLQQQQGVSLASCADTRQAQGAAYCFRTMALSSQCLSRRVSKCTIQMLDRYSTCWCDPTAGLLLNSKYDPVRQQLQQKRAKSRSGGCLEQSEDRKSTVPVTVGTTVTSCPNVKFCQDTKI